MITTKQKCYLRSLAQTIKPVFQIGKDGINENMLRDILAYLNKNELMKISLLQNATITMDDAINILEQADIFVVQKIGRQIVCYKHSDNAKNPIIFEK